jgi:nucleoside-diphosphate-sugar epimerase
MTRTAFVAGATGAAAKRLVEELLRQGWRVIGMSRRPPAAKSAMVHVPADLMNPTEVRQALSPHRDITHLFYTSRAPHGESGVESVEDNVAMLRHALDAAEAASPALEHVHLVEGTKWYGMHIGPFRTPAREDDPRHIPPNFYYDQQDLLAARCEGKRWTWSASRPGFLVDFAPERPRNIPAVLGAYAAICRELGVPFDFPGTEASFRAAAECTDASLLARAMVFVATAPFGRNQAFNVTNGDIYRWRHLWPKLAAFYGVPVGEVRPMRLAQWMADKEPVWQAITRRHDLVPRPLDEVALWPFADFCLGQGHDVISSTTKIRQAGFHDVLDSEAMYLDLARRYREARLLP